MEENSYLRVYRTNITNHLPEGVSEASLVQAGSVESEQALSLQRSWEQRPQAHAVSGGQNPAEGERKRWGKPRSLQETGTQEEESTAASPGSGCRGDFKFPFRAALIKTRTQKS